MSQMCYYCDTFSVVFMDTAKMQMPEKTEEKIFDLSINTVVINSLVW